MSIMATTRCMEASVWNARAEGKTMGDLSGNRQRVVAIRDLPVSKVRLDLVVALTRQAATQAQRAAESFANEGLKYAVPRRSEARTLEEALMTVPDLETIPYSVIKRVGGFELRVVESYLVAETEMAGTTGFDFFSSGQAFNTVADYIFGKNTKREAMEMTTPVLTSRADSKSQKMDMTTPVLTQRESQGGKWQMAFVLPSKFDEGSLPVPDNPSVRIRRVPSKLVAVTVFTGYVTDDLVKSKERDLRLALRRDGTVRPRSGAEPEVAQYNPPFTPPFMRRNEVALEVEYVDEDE